MARTTLVERTAKEPFRLGDEPIARGRIVQLTPAQLKALSEAGCVALTEEENETVPQAGLPPIQAALGLIEGREIERRLADARRAAGEDLETLQQNLAEARDKAEAEVRAQQARIDNAREQADLAIADHQRRVTEATAAPDAAVIEQERRAAEAKSKAEAAADKTKRSGADAA